MFIFYSLVFFCTNIFASDNTSVHVAVSSNFLPAIKSIVKEFEDQSYCKVIVSSDATSILYNKIIRGAPFEVFISADAKHPMLLEDVNTKSHFYCYGSLVLFTPNLKYCKNILRKIITVKYLVLANISLSPYGYFANEVFNNLKFSHKNLVYGLNITNVFNFIRIGSDCIGFVALSQVITSLVDTRIYWLLPVYLYGEIEQRFIVLKKVDSNLCLLKFLNYFISDNAKKIMIMYGYKVTE